MLTQRLLRSLGTFNQQCLSSSGNKFVPVYQRTLVRFRRHKFQHSSNPGSGTTHSSASVLGQGSFWDRYLLITLQNGIVAYFQKALRNFLTKINNHVIRVVDELDTKRPVNITTLFETSSFELMSSISFSEEHGQRSSQELAEMLSTLHTNQLLLIGIGHVPWVYTFREWFPFLIPSTAKFRAYASEMLNRRLALKPTTPDLFSYLSKAENSDSPHFPVEWEARLSTVAGR
jgi:hypothetical protein